MNCKKIYEQGPTDKTEELISHIPRRQGLHPCLHPEEAFFRLRVFSGQGITLNPTGARPAWTLLKKGESTPHTSNSTTTCRNAYASRYSLSRRCSGEGGALTTSNCRPLQGSSHWKTSFPGSLISRDGGNGCLSF